MRSQLSEMIEAKRHEQATLAARPSATEIRYVREKIGSSMGEFGTLFHPRVSASTVCRWESGERSPDFGHTVQLLELIAEVRELVA